MTGNIKTAIDRLDGVVVPLLRKAAPVGAAIGVVYDGELVYEHMHGYADIATGRAVDRNTAFRIGSISKTFTGIGIMQLREQGRLDLDDPITAHLRSYRWQQPPGTRPATIRDVMTHTAGIGELRGWGDLLLGSDGALGVKDGKPIPTLPELYAAGLRTNIAPGRKWAYANHAIATLGQIIEDISGMPFPAYMNEHVFDPLGMTGTDFLLGHRVGDRVARGYVMKHGGIKPVPWKHVTVHAAGSTFSSVAEMARYAAALMNGGGNDTGSVLKPDTLEEMFEPHWSPDPRIPTQGLVFLRDDFDGHRIVWHDGGWPAFTSSMLVAPDDRLAVLAFNNTGSGVIHEIAEAALRSLLGVPQVVDSVPRPAVLPSPQVWGDLAGVYAPEPDINTNLRHIERYGNELTVEIRGNRLTLRSLTGALKKGVDLHPVDANDPLVFDAVVPSQRGSTLRMRVAFSRGPDGRVDTMAGTYLLPFVFRRRGPWRSVRVAARRVGVGLAVGALVAAIAGCGSTVQQVGGTANEPGSGVTGNNLSVPGSATGLAGPPAVTASIPGATSVGVPGSSPANRPGSTATTPTGTVPNGSTPASLAAGPPIRLGYTVFDTTGVTALTGTTNNAYSRNGQTSSSDADAKMREMKALIKYANATGGIGGRKIVGFPYRLTAADIDQNSRVAKCTKATEDDHVQAYIDNNGFFTEEDFACFAAHHVTYVGWADTTDRKFLAEHAPYLVTPLPAADRAAQAMVEGAANVGYFNKAHVGILIDDVPTLHNIYDTVMKPALARVGVTDPKVFYMAPTPADGPQSAQASNAVLQFRQAGVDHVMMLINVTGYLSFSNAAASQGYRPRYASSDYQLLDNGILGFDQTHTIDGSIAISSMRPTILDKPHPRSASDDYTRRELRNDPGFKRCLDVYTKYTGLNYYKGSVGRSSGFNDYCNHFFLWLDAARAVRGPFSPLAWAQGLAALGTSFRSTIENTERFGSGLYDGAADYRVGIFTNASTPCLCYQAVRPTWYPMPY